MSDASLPSEKNSAEVTLDHEYDGISEYDNPLPRWWVWIFWATFVFAIGYFFHYQLSGKGQDRIVDFEEDVRVANELAMKASAKETVSEDSLAKLLDNAASQAAGAAIYAARCQSCHAERGKGLIGPNLTDGFWLHGSGRLMDIFETVSKGVLAKGMPAWNKQLSPMELRNVVAYVGELRGKNLPGKEPQGEPSGATATTDGAAPAVSGSGAESIGIGMAGSPSVVAGAVPASAGAATEGAASDRTESVSAPNAATSASVPNSAVPVRVTSPVIAPKVVSAPEAPPPADQPGAAAIAGPPSGSPSPAVSAQ